MQEMLKEYIKYKGYAKVAKRVGRSRGNVYEWVNREGRHIPTDMLDVVVDMVQEDRKYFIDKFNPANY